MTAAAMRCRKRRRAMPGSSTCSNAATRWWTCAAAKKRRDYEDEWRELLILTPSHTTKPDDLARLIKANSAAVRC